MVFKGNRRNLIIRWVIIKVVSSLPPETAEEGGDTTCLGKACLEAKGRAGTWRTPPAREVPEVMLVKLLSSWKKGSPETQGRCHKYACVFYPLSSV